MTQQTRTSPFTTAFRATLGVFACLIFLFISGCSALFGLLWFVGHSAAQDATERLAAIENVQSLPDVKVPVLQSQPGYNDPALKDVLSNLECLGREGIATYYVARGVTSDNVLLYLAATGKYLRAETPSTPGKGKVLLVCCKGGTETHVGMVNYRNGRPEYFSVAPNVDEIVALTDMEWAAINRFAYLFYDVYKGNLSVEEENALREEVSSEYGVSKEMWMKRVRASIQDDVTEQVMAIMENREPVGLPQQTSTANDGLDSSSESPSQAMMPPENIEVPASESSAKVTLVGIVSGVPLLYVESSTEILRMQVKEGETVYRTWTLKSIARSGTSVTLIDSTTGNSRNITKGNPIILE